MAEITGGHFSTTKVASGNLDGSQFTFVRQIGQDDILTIVTTGVLPLGVLQDKPQNNEHGKVLTLGHSKVRVASSLGSNIFIMAGVSGFAVAAASGQVTCGRLITGATSGSLAEAFVNIQANSL